MVRILVEMFVNGLFHFFVIFSLLQILTNLYFKVNISFKQKNYVALHFEKNCDKFFFKVLMLK